MQNGTAEGVIGTGFGKAVARTRLAAAERNTALRLAPTPYHVGRVPEPHGRGKQAGAS